MNSRRFLSSLLAGRFWLVLALAPLLFLSGAGESLHNHPLLEQVASRSRKVAAGGEKVVKIEAPHALSGAAGICLVCLWQSQNQGRIAAAALQILPSRMRDVEFSRALALHGHNSSAYPATRGPPSI